MIKTREKFRAGITSIGHYLPERIITNQELSEFLDTSNEWIVSRTGIHQRHRAHTNEATSDMAVRAARNALKDITPGSIEAVIVATTTPDYRCPATAPLIAAQLGLSTIPAFDVSAVCSGFLYALATANAYVTSGMMQRVLVIAAEKFSDLIDPTDRKTACLFGDGAAAVVVSQVDETTPGAIHAMNLHSDGSKADFIIVEGGGTRRPWSSELTASQRFLQMKGQEVFTAAVQGMTHSIKHVIENVGWDIEDVDVVIAHQANKRILDAIARELSIAPEKFVLHLDRVGNTAGASIPLAMAANRNSISTSSKVLLTAYGAGTTWGSAALTWPEFGMSN